MFYPENNENYDIIWSLIKETVINHFQGLAYFSVWPLFVNPGAFVYSFQIIIWKKSYEEVNGFLQLFWAHEKWKRMRFFNYGPSYFELKL